MANCAHGLQPSGLLQSRDCEEFQGSGRAGGAVRLVTLCWYRSTKSQRVPACRHINLTRACDAVEHGRGRWIAVKILPGMHIQM